MPLMPAAIGIILNADSSQILLVKRSDVPVWVLPGGGIENHEMPEDALRREILEETGLHIYLIRKCAEYTPINCLASFTHVFICKIETGEIRLSNETSDISFYSVQKLPLSIFPPHAKWITEALSHSELVRRPLREISYLAIFKYFLRHPWQVLRFAWTRMTT
jgi:ADP-ribose pyrophosphatase YjhB (NUDIX family)